MYRRALAASDAGLIELRREDDPCSVEMSLLEAADHLGLSIVTGWIGDDRQTLAWRRWPERPGPDLRILAIEGDDPV